MRRCVSRYFVFVEELGNGVDEGRDVRKVVLDPNAWDAQGALVSSAFSKTFHGQRRDWLVPVLHARVPSQTGERRQSTRLRYLIFQQDADPVEDGVGDVVIRRRKVSSRLGVTTRIGKCLEENAQVLSDET